MVAQTREVVFRPRARLVSMLGEHLISDQAVGLIELVKNAYDADATEVQIDLRNLRDPQETTITISDNGEGMTADVIEDRWLSPAADYKERQKLAGACTPRGRLPIGEKGIGRFAVQQMGRRLEMVTRAEGGPEIVVDVNWDRFDESDLYLDQAPARLTERDPQVFKGNSTGTRMVIRESRSTWNRKLLRKVRRTLRRLQSPLIDEQMKPEFRVLLRCPEYPEYENIDPSDLLDQAHYVFLAEVSEDGDCNWEYQCFHPALPSRKEVGTKDLRELAPRGELEDNPSCGQFWLSLYVWDRSPQYFDAPASTREELDQFSGVALYRDGLRVLPYGEPGDDWLLLDQERINNPSERLSNNQVIGFVEVEQKTSHQLRDKTNREGLIDNQAFQDLRALVRAAIRQFRQQWLKDRPKKAVAAATGTSTTSVESTPTGVRAPVENAGSTSVIQQPTNGHVSVAQNTGTLAIPQPAVEILSEHPTRYAAGLVAAQRAPDPVRILTGWGVPETTSSHVINGLGLIHLLKNAVPTQRGQAFAELFVSLGFDAETWAVTPPSTADDLGTRVGAALRLLLLESPAVALVTRVLQENGAKPVNMAALVELVDKADPVLTRMAIGSRSMTGDWQIYPQARFELKQILFQSGFLSDGPTESLSRHGVAYEPELDVWTPAHSARMVLIS